MRVAAVEVKLGRGLELDRLIVIRDGAIIVALPVVGDAAIVEGAANLALSLIA